MFPIVLIEISLNAFGVSFPIPTAFPRLFKNEFESAGFKVREVLTKGLDIQHIKTISEVYPEVFKPNDNEYMFDNADELQDMINLNCKGDNLRLFAQKI